MMIITIDCWKCEKGMKMALVSDEESAYRGPETFSENEISLAQKNGVLIKNVDSQTAEETYKANICPHCDSFIGKWFFFANYYTPALYGDLKYTEV
jgi:hypothetical protein